MIITSKITMDLQNPGISPRICAVQTDRYSRDLQITLYAGNAPFPVPDNTAVMIRYRKSDGKGGEYDTLPDGRSAWSIHGNVLTVALAPQVLTFPGSVDLSVSLICGGRQLSLLPIDLQVEPLAFAPIAKSENYFYISSLLTAPSRGAVGQLLQISAVNTKGAVTDVEAVDWPESSTGVPGADGGYYTPVATDNGDGTMEVSLTPSKADMPPVDPKTIRLPAGPQGSAGADGHTPVKGVDYFTDADKAEMVQDVIDALGGSPVFGTVDADNNIILTGELADGTYTLKYEDAEGNQTEIGTIVVGAETMPDSGTVELTWATGVKLDKTTGAEGTGDGYSASQSVEIANGYTYTVTGTANYHGMTICFYDADGAYLGHTELWSASAHSEPISSVITMMENTASIRLRAYHSNSDIAACITLSFAKTV